MRSFFAISLPGSLRRELHSLQSEGLQDAVRWQDPTLMHLTLRFLGECERGLLEELATGARGIRLPPFEIALRGSGVFPSPEKPSVIWMGVDGGPNLKQLYRAVEEGCVDAGLEPNDRAFVPHVTMGRSRETRPEDVRRIREWLERHEGWEREGIPVTEFKLMVSSQGPDGVKYDEFARFSLNA